MGAAPATRNHGRPGGRGFPVRAAALLALTAPVAMVVVAAIALSGNVAIAAVAVASILVACGAVWVALTNRGTRRYAGAGLALLAAAGLVVVIATHWQGVLVLVALLLLLAAFGIAARFALGTTGEAQLERPAARAARAGPGALIINLKSAEMIGVRVPQVVRVRAQEVIE